MTPPVLAILDHAGSFAENKDIAKQLRERVIIPALRAGQPVVIDFDQVSGTTQSFVHALISGPVRQFRNFALDNLLFKNCSPEVQAVVRIVFAYMQESMDISEE
jgi:hypothetical protein